MKLSTLLTLSFSLAGGLAAGQLLRRRHQWEKSNNQIAICVDFDDAQAAAIRAGLSFPEMLAKLAEHGATHLSLPELSLNRLQAVGLLLPYAPSRLRSTPPPVGHWNYLRGPAGLINYLAAELATRLPYTQAVPAGESILAFAGDLPTIGEIGLGFDQELAAHIRQAGLAIVPRPVSYSWPEKTLLERTLTQAAQLGPWVAFEGNMILGHEMHLNETLAAMEQHQLSLVYFSQSRHQKGDWFIAKRRAPHVILAHRFTPEEMIPLDFHAAVHNWVNLARERGIRFCYLNFFRVLHATAPLEGLSYLAHLKEGMEKAGYVVSGRDIPPTPIPTPSPTDLALAGLAPAAAAAAALSHTLQLSEPLAVPLALVATGGAMAIPFVEQAYLSGRNSHHHHHDNDHHHHDNDSHHHHHDDSHHHHHDDHEHPDLHTLYPPSYTPKLLALTATTLAPIAAQKSGAVGVIYPAGSALALAAFTSGPEYQLKIESYRGFNLDWFIPLAHTTWQIQSPTWRWALLIGLGVIWGVARQRGIEDLLAPLDPSHAEGHTHHISAAMRLVGDVLLTVGPQPARKWGWLGPAGQWASLYVQSQQTRILTQYISTIAYILGLSAMRRPERALAVTLEKLLPHA